MTDLSKRKLERRIERLEEKEDELVEKGQLPERGKYPGRSNPRDWTTIQITKALKERIDGFDYPDGVTTYGQKIEHLAAVWAEERGNSS